MAGLPFRAARFCGGSMSSPECTARMVITTTQQLNLLTASPAFKKWERRKRRKQLSQLKAQEGDVKAAIVLLLLVFCSGAILGYLTGSATRVDNPPPPTVLPEKCPECPMQISGARNSSREVAALKNRLKTEQQEHQAVFNEMEHMLQKMGSKMSSMKQDFERSKSFWMYGSCILIAALVGVCMCLMMPSMETCKRSKIPRNLNKAHSERGKESKHPNGVCKEPNNYQEAFVDAEIRLPAKMENKDLAVHESHVTASKLVKQAIHTLEDSDCNGLDSPAVADSIVSNSVCYGRVLLALGDDGEDQRVPTAFYRGCMR